MTKLSTTLITKKAQGEKALVAYIVAGDPVPGETVAIMHELVQAGVDVIELGVPFSDPEAEGPVIQLAHERALKHKVTLADCLDMVAAFRKDNTTTPIVLMGYLNPIEIMGYPVFAEKAAAAGVNGTIIVNLPPEEAGDVKAVFDTAGIEQVYLLAPTTTDERAAKICSASRGFVYYVSLKGTTGAASLDVADVAEKMARFSRLSELPILVGFGIHDADSARAVAAVADGVVVGSAIVKRMEQYGGDPVQLRRELSSFVTGLRAAIDEQPA